MLLLLAAAVLLFPGHPRAQWKTRWTYDGALGPDHWGDLDPDYALCRLGKEQSPIDIRNAEKADVPPIRFEYQSGPFRYLTNNGHTIRMNYHDVPGRGNFLVVGDKRYRLMQFHFHRPSEELIDGKPYDMVIHFMHEADDGKVAGVAILLRAGHANASIRQIWDHMPPDDGKEYDIAGQEFNPVGLLPSAYRPNGPFPHDAALYPVGPLPPNTAYYSYMGSLTAPPCTEGVTWFVLKTPVEISSEQINAFAKLYPHDVRPPQPLNGRIVKESR